MARKRVDSDRARLMNARKQLKQISEDLKRDVDNPIAANFASQIDEYIKGTYGSKSQNEITKILGTVNDVKMITSKESGLRKEKIMERNIAQASTGGVSTYSKEEVKIFYNATQKYWDGLPIEKRNAAIKEKLGVETLEEAWQKVFEDENVKKALAMAQGAQQPISSDGDASLMDGSTDEKDAKGSPQYIKYLTLLLDTD